MTKVYLHNHPEFQTVINVVSGLKKIPPILIEKDYWIMHCLYGLKKMDIDFELKGGTSLSKGFGIIKRFSEDIDVFIRPKGVNPSKTSFNLTIDQQPIKVMCGKNHDKETHKQSRKLYFEYLEKYIHIDGIVETERINLKEDDSFGYRNCRIHLRYPSATLNNPGLKEGILLEIGFDNVVPNEQRTITSWIYDHAASELDIIDNRAVNVRCYDYRYTFVEKLQAIARKYRLYREKGTPPQDFIRHYYDVYCLLEREDIQNFIGTDDYFNHRDKRFSQSDKPELLHKEAYLLTNHEARQRFQNIYETVIEILFIEDHPPFESILSRINRFAEKF